MLPHPLITRFESIVGGRHVLTRDRDVRRYGQGYRFGGGKVFAVVRPGSLLEQWKVLTACVAADVIVIAQAANTGLTGGSTPDGETYERPVVLLNTMRIRGIHLIGDGRQAVCLPGATLDRLETTLRPLGREPHSVIGSSCIGASVVGGVCNNSGGALVQRGPAYTELALYARRNPDGRLELVNHLGIELGSTPEDMLAALEGDGRDLTPLVLSEEGQASDRDYRNQVREVDSPTPARYNANPRTLFEASGSAGKIIIFALRLDTFAQERARQVFYIGSNDPAELASLRRHMLKHFQHLPVAAEYMHREAFTVTERYCKDSFLAIRLLGAKRLPLLFAAKSVIDALATRSRFLPTGFADRLLQWMATLFPSHLPPRMRLWRDRFEHHLLLQMAGEGIAEADAHLGRIFPSLTGAMFRCTADEGRKAFLHRFAVAGAAIRYRALHPATVEDIVALDIALPRNMQTWFEQLDDVVSSQLVHRIYYGHFFCHVLHQDYVVAKGCDAHALEARILETLDRRGAIYPAEHNVGHLYDAAPTLASHYRTLDPTNRFNPGIGRLPRTRDWGATAADGDATMLPQHEPAQCSDHLHDQHH